MPLHSDPRSRFDADVVVVGAGPIGLTLACALARHGVRFRIVEKKSGPSGDSKGHVLNPRSQELLQAVGVREGIAAQSYRPRRMLMVLDGNPLPQPREPALDTPYPEGLLSHQGTIEAELVRVLEERGATVERGRPLVASEQDEDGVTVELGDDDGRMVERLRCRYLVGADGANGIVRKTIGLDFTTETLPDRAIRQVDARLSWRRSTGLDQAWFFLFHGGFAGVIPVWEGLYRLFFIEDEARVPDRDPTLEEMVTRAREVTGDETFSMSDPVWFSHGRFRHGVAPAYGRGRVFLAGDGGHRTLPIGGQGMNAGLHDAVGLGWRLAMTLAGEAGPAVLDSYGPERQGAHAELGCEQVSGFKRLMYRSRAADTVIGAVADFAPGLFSRLLGGQDLTQLGVGYPDSPLSDDHGWSVPLFGTVEPAAGSRAPDAHLVASNGADTRLFDWIYEPDGRSWGWRLLLFDGRQTEAHAHFATICAAVEPWRWVRPLFVLANPARFADQHHEQPFLFDLDEEAHRAYGLKRTPAVVLVRPDGHIAFRSKGTEHERLAAYCAKVSGRPA